MTYTYGCLQRPPGPGAIPKFGLLEVRAFKKQIAIKGAVVWGLVDYERELSPKERSNYELLLLEVVDEL